MYLLLISQCHQFYIYFLCRGLRELAQYIYNNFTFHFHIFISAPPPSHDATCLFIIHMGKNKLYKTTIILKTKPFFDVQDVTSECIHAFQLKQPFKSIFSFFSTVGSIYCISFISLPTWNHNSLFIHLKFLKLVNMHGRQMISSF